MNEILRYLVESLVASRNRGTRITRKFKGEFDFGFRGLIFKILNFVKIQKVRSLGIHWLVGNFYFEILFFSLSDLSNFINNLGFGMFYLREIGKYFIEKYFFYRKKKNYSPLSTISRFYGYNIGRFIFSLSVLNEQNFR